MSLFFGFLDGTDVYAQPNRGHWRWDSKHAKKTLALILHYMLSCYISGQRWLHFSGGQSVFAAWPVKCFGILWDERHNLYKMTFILNIAIIFTMLMPLNH